MKKMKKVLLSLIFLGFIVTVSAQKVYFIYLQSESNQPFFVNMNDKIFSSTASGYLILSKLPDSTYRFKIGFSDKKWPEQDFAVSMNQKDHGYLIKNFGEKWGLFDLQTMAVNMSASKSLERTIRSENKNVSEFTDVLARAADDSSLKEKPVDLVVSNEKIIPKSEVLKPTVLENSVTTDSLSNLKEKNSNKTEITRKNNDQETFEPSTVTKNSENSTTAGFGLVFIDEYKDGQKDTISLLIPESKKKATDSKKNPEQKMKFQETPSDVNGDMNNSKKEMLPTDKSIIEKTKLFVKNCSNSADDIDFFILRKRMATVNSENGMLDEAAEYFKLKCFTAVQIKNLGTLFLKEDGKYRFFEIAYPVVADKNNFPLLETEFKDEFFINKFRSLLRN